MHIHPNTVRYRLDRISDLTGIDLGHPGQRLTLDLAVVLNAYLQGGVVTPGAQPAFRPVSP